MPHDRIERLVLGLGALDDAGACVLYARAALLHASVLRRKAGGHRVLTDVFLLVASGEPASTCCARQAFIQPLVLSLHRARRLALRQTFVAQTRTRCRTRCTLLP